LPSVKNKHTANQFLPSVFFLLCVFLVTLGKSALCRVLKIKHSANKKTLGKSAVSRSDCTEHVLRFKTARALNKSSDTCCTKMNIMRTNKNWGSLGWYFGSIPASTVTSKSSFFYWRQTFWVTIEAGLNSGKIEALICLQDWLRSEDSTHDNIAGNIAVDESDCI